MDDGRRKVAHHDRIALLGRQTPRVQRTVIARRRHVHAMHDRLHAENVHVMRAAVDERLDLADRLLAAEP